MAELLENALKFRLANKQILRYSDETVVALCYITVSWILSRLIVKGGDIRKRLI